MKMINKMGLAASLILASSLANAGAYNLGDITATDASGNVTVDESFGLLAGAFTDTFNFTLSEDNFFEAFAVSGNAAISAFTSMNVLGYFGTPSTTGSFSIIDLTQGVQLAAGSYNLVVSGVATGNASAGYALTTITSPVPEPSSIALMLGGLGLVGFMAARRSKKA
ncbi:MAG: FxDxF family PEP-CTERM protein [Thiomicrorhabdus sp.]|nr:FxDxF family PEP-CTERM protein [Thiomicrorhabdus sp.]